MYAPASISAHGLRIIVKRLNIDVPMKAGAQVIESGTLLFVKSNTQQMTQTQSGGNVACFPPESNGQQTKPRFDYIRLAFLYCRVETTVCSNTGVRTQDVGDLGADCHLDGWHDRTDGAQPSPAAGTHQSPSVSLSLLLQSGGEPFNSSRRLQRDSENGTRKIPKSF